MIQNVKSCVTKKNYDALFNMVNVVKLDMSNNSISILTRDGSTHSFSSDGEAEEKSYRKLREELRNLEGIKKIE